MADLAWGRLRRTAASVADGLYMTGGMVGLVGTLVLPRRSGAGFGAAFRMWGVGFLLTAPLSLPLLALGWVTDKVFHTGPVREADLRADLEKQKP